MKLYDFTGAPNPRKVRIYLAEKGIRVPLEQVNIMTGENRTPEFLAKNPLGGLPVLELDDGSRLSESLAIIEYFEELHPNPPMIGTTPIDRARVRSLERIIELNVMQNIGTVFQHTSPLLVARLKQLPEMADLGRTRLATGLAVVDQMIGAKPFAAGDRPTIADCTLLAALDFAQFAQVTIDPSFAHLARWSEAFHRRPSAQA